MMKDRRKISRCGEFSPLLEKRKLNANFRHCNCGCAKNREEDQMSCVFIRDDEIKGREESCVELIKRIGENGLNENCNFVEEVRWCCKGNISSGNCSRSNLNRKSVAPEGCSYNKLENNYTAINTNLVTVKKVSKSYSYCAFQYGLSGFYTKVLEFTLFCYNVSLSTIKEWRGHWPLLRVQCNSSPPHRRKRTPSLASGRHVALWSVIILNLLALLQCCASTAASRCDVYASGLDRAGREVGAEYVRCLAGRLVWKYPRNGLRLLLQSPQEGREFRGCIKADPEFDGAQVLVEGKNSLVPLLRPHDHLPLQRERCFSSYEAKVALYLEASPLPNDQHLSAHTAAFQYDLELLPPGTYYSPDQECRPCSDDELLEAACSSDIVATGRLISVEVESDTSSAMGTFDGSNSIEGATRSAIDLSFLTPSPLSVLGTGPSSLPPSSRSVLKFAASKITRELTGGGDAVFQKARGGGVVASIDIPSHCGMRAGPGTYLLMARMKMGSPKLKCIPRLTDFETLAQNRKSDLQCLLKL